MIKFLVPLLMILVIASCSSAKIIQPTASKIAYVDFKETINKPFEETWGSMLSFLKKSDFNVYSAVKESRMIAANKSYQNGETGYERYMDCGKCEGGLCQDRYNSGHIIFTVTFRENLNKTVIAVKVSGNVVYSYNEISGWGALPAAKSVTCVSKGVIEKEITNFLRR